METGVPFFGKDARLLNICTGEGGVLNAVLGLSFVVALLLFLALVLMVWFRDRHRKTDKGMWRGLVFDKDQMAIFRAYFTTGKGRLHGAALVMSTGLSVLSVAFAFAYYGVTTGDCPAL
jgi:hypothetical protein